MACWQHCKLAKCQIDKTWCKNKLMKRQVDKNSTFKKIQINQMTCWLKNSLMKEQVDKMSQRSESIWCWIRGKYWKKHFKTFHQIFMKMIHQLFHALYSDILRIKNFPENVTFTVTKNHCKMSLKTNWQNLFLSLNQAIRDWHF